MHKSSWNITKALEVFFRISVVFNCYTRFKVTDTKLKTVVISVSQFCQGYFVRLLLLKDCLLLWTLILRLSAPMAVLFKLLF